MLLYHTIDLDARDIDMIKLKPFNLSLCCQMVNRFQMCIQNKSEKNTQVDFKEIVPQRIIPQSYSRRKLSVQKKLQLKPKFVIQILAWKAG